MGTIRLLIVDDHPTYLEGLSRLLEDEEDLECIGKSEDGAKAVKLAGELQPDVAIIDVSMPSLNGIDTAKQIKAISPNTAILMISAFDYQSYILASLRAGASGYMSKSMPLNELVSAIRLVHDGDRVLDLKATDKVVRYLSASDERDGTDSEILHPRELEILKLAARGMSNKAIAGELYISERTVQTHLVNIFKKLGVSSRTQAALYIIQKGWVAPSELS